MVVQPGPKGKAAEPAKLTPTQSQWLKRWGKHPGLQRLEAKDIGRFIMEEDTEKLSEEVLKMYKGDLRAARYDMKHLATLVWEAMAELSSNVPLEKQRWPLDVTPAQAAQYIFQWKSKSHAVRTSE